MHCCCRKKSVFEIQDKFFVYELDADNRVKMTSVIPSYRLPELYVIESGLTATSRVVYEGIQLVTAGEMIQPKIVPFPGPAKP
jgi:membrane fusion protein (multidrug efflux system)